MLDSSVSVTSRKDIEHLDTVLPWYAVYVRSNFERIVYRNLLDKGYDLFLPTYHSQRRWSDRVKALELPLFPGYLFCRLDPQNRLPVLTAPGVVQVVGNGKSPLPIPDEEIAAIHTVLKSKLPCVPWTSTSPGRRVVIQEGPLMGVQGVLIEARGPYRIAVSITMLQRSVAVEVDASWVKPIQPPDTGNARRPAPYLF
jgi:transcription antitermination factor NusG